MNDKNKTSLVLKIAYRNPKPSIASQISTSFFRSNVDQGGFIYSQAKPEEAAAIYIYNAGVSSSAISKFIDEGLLTGKERTFFQRVTNLVTLLESADPNLTDKLQGLNSNPNSISVVKEVPKGEPKGSYIEFERKEGSFQLAKENFNLEGTPVSSQAVASLSLDEKLNHSLDYGKTSGLYDVKFYQSFERPYSPPSDSDIQSTPQVQPQAGPIPPAPTKTTIPPHPRAQPVAQKGGASTAVADTAKFGVRKGLSALGGAVGNAVLPVLGTAGAWVGDQLGQAVTDPVGFFKKMLKYTAYATGILVGYLLTLITGWIIEIVIGFLSLITLTIVILIIINNGAYVVPQGGFEALPPGPGPLADECPSIWPFIGRSAVITQGAYAPGCSHVTLEASDYGLSTNATVVATHNGRVIRSAVDSCLGNVIYVQSTCQGLSFFSIYAHLSSRSVATGSNVSRGTSIGRSGNTGSCTSGPHLHYGFKYSETQSTGANNSTYTRHPPYMSLPYLPVALTRGCCQDTTSCGVTASP